MCPFVECEWPAEALDVQGTMVKFGLTRAQAAEQVRRLARQVVYRNDLYQVAIDAGACEPFLHLSIKRIDREPIHDWRHLQAIKNELVGAEREAFEVYPAESRLVDAANQYHLWALPEGARLPVGFDKRLTATPEEAAAVGSKQRRREA